MAQKKAEENLKNKNVKLKQQQLQKKIKLSKVTELNSLQTEEQKLLSDQNAAQKLLNESNTKLTNAINSNDMSEVKIAQMMLSVANSEMQKINEKLTECCSKQQNLKQMIQN